MGFKLKILDIIQAYDLNSKILSSVLFPENKHPRLAFARLITEDVPLKEKQIYRLLMFLGLSFEELAALKKPALDSVVLVGEKALLVSRRSGSILFDLTSYNILTSDRTHFFELQEL